MQMAVAFILAYPYGYFRVMSSFFFEDPKRGPPLLPPSFNSDGTCGNGWVCEHRWRQICSMVHFMKFVAGD
jgi:alpha-amylase